tara:strand:- start:121 stop:2427 length:2307 start_codon:yes stop_codon:yes gene_type:complete
MNKKDIKFSEQGYLIYEKFIKNKGIRTRSKDSKSDINLEALKDSITVHKVIGQYTPVDFISKVTKKNKLNTYKNLFDLETHKLTSLVPYVKLFKVENNKNIPFYFPTAAEKTTIQSILQQGSGINASAIQSFDMKFTGQDPFTLDKQIECSLVIFVDTLENIFKEPPAGFATLADIFTISRTKYKSLKESMSKEVSSQQINRASSHEILASVGYHVDSKSTIFSRKERQAVENTVTTVRLTITNHNISLNQDGTATISIDFIGRLSGLLNDSFYNVLANEADLLALSDFQDEKEDILLEPDEAIRKEKREALDKRIRQSVRTRFRKVLEYLEVGGKVADIAYENTRIHNLSLSNSDIKEYLDFVTTAKKSSVATQSSNPKPAADKIDENSDSPDDKEAASKTKSKIESKAFIANTKSIDYIFLGDFLESLIVITKNTIEEAINDVEKDRKLTNSLKTSKKLKPLTESLESLKTTKLLLGNFVYPVGKEESITVNAADIPLSLRVIQDYVFENIEQQHKIRHTLGNLFTDVVTKILPRALKQHTYIDAPEIDDVTYKSIILTGDKVKDLEFGVDVDIKNLPDFVKQKSRKRSADDDIDYLVMYAEISKKMPSGLDGNLRKDASNGIYHFNLGKDRGMLKSINFSQINQQFRREALMMESVSLYDELKMPYSASITMFGNGLFLPGSVVYINPSSVGFGDPRNKRSASARLGLGGYYTVISVQTTFNSGQLNTTLQAEYLSWADADTTRMSETIDSLRLQALATIDRGER